MLTFLFSRSKPTTLYLDSTKPAVPINKRPISRPSAHAPGNMSGHSWTRSLQPPPKLRHGMSDCVSVRQPWMASRRCLHCQDCRTSAFTFPDVMITVLDPRAPEFLRFQCPNRNSFAVTKRAHNSLHCERRFGLTSRPLKLRVSHQ